jgi:hypothetical protein
LSCWGENIYLYRHLTLISKKIVAMKKLLLLVASGLAMLPAMAQQSTNSVVKLNHPVKLGEPSTAGPLRVNTAGLGANKTTTNMPEWFSYVDILYVTSVSKGYYNVVYQDSNLVYQGSAGLDNVWNYGMGVSFDPTDSTFFASSVSAGLPDPAYQPSFVVRDTNQYWIDSFAFPMKYYRTQAAALDTLVIQFAKVNTKYSSLNPTGLYSLQFTSSGEKFATVAYDSITNRFSSIVPTSAVTTIKVPLNAAFAADTTANGYSRIAATGLSLNHYAVAPNEKVISWVTFKSGLNYPLGTNVTNANYIRLYSYDLPGAGAAPIQNQNSRYTGLVATTEIKYEYNGDFTYQGRSVLIPSIAYTADGFMMDMAFKVDCPDCWLVGVKDVNNVFGQVKTYPNPANDKISIAFSMKDAATSTVSITNTVGQVLKTKSLVKSSSSMATFSTSDLANGVYFYTIESNGNHTSGRFVVAH